MTKRTKKRSYRMEARARAQDETRRRIVEAAVHLHEKLGPAATPISAIAAHAGVQRLTVYRHFPDEAALFAACTAHWGALHPAPEPAHWRAIADPMDRFEGALAAWCAYYAETQGMLRVAYRDAAQVKPIRPAVARLDSLLDETAKALAAGFGAKGPAARRIAMTIRHLIAFSTWSDLDRRGLTDADKVALGGAWLEGARRAARPR